jgi:pimeloyl-ACP methyl ester carboxylesterase
LILHGRIVEQVVDGGERAQFIKELVVARTAGRVPLSIVRKRAKSQGGGTRAPILLVHGFGQNRYAWHLPSRSLANYLARAGFDVFNLDLRGHGRSRHLGARPCRGIDDYVREDLPSAVEEVFELSGRRPVFLVGHSLGGLVSYACAPLLDGALGGICTIGSPYHVARGSFILSAFGVFVRGVGIANVGNVPIPIRTIGSTMRFFRWLTESPVNPIPRPWARGKLEAHVLEEHVRLAFDVAGLNEMVDIFSWNRENDHTNRFEKLDLPLLVIAGTKDDLAPAAGVRPGFERSRARDKTYRAMPFGHIDLLVGRDAPRTTWEAVRSWLVARAGERARAVLRTV